MTEDEQFRMARSFFPQGVHHPQPYGVKNTFLHIETEGQPDIYDRSHTRVRRERSEPPKMRQFAEQDHVEQLAEQERLLYYQAACERTNLAPGSWEVDSALDTNDTEDSWEEDPNLHIHSELRWKPHSSRQVSTKSSNYSNWSNFSTGDDDAEGSPTPQVPPNMPMLGAFRGKGCAQGSARADTGSTPESQAVPDTDGQDGTGGILGFGGRARERRQLKQNWDPHSWDSGVVTVMIRQVPRQLTQLLFRQEINRQGFEGLYDFLYLPCDMKKGINVGYGFLNFIAPEHAQAFRAKLDGAYLDRHHRVKGKPLHVHPAKVQGYEANYAHFSQTKTGQKQDPHFSPIFYPQGQGRTDGSSRMQPPANPGPQDWAMPAHFAPGNGMVLFEADPEGRGGMCPGALWHVPRPYNPEPQAQAPSPTDWTTPYSGEAMRQGAHFRDETSPASSPADWTTPYSGETMRQGPHHFQDARGAQEWQEQPRGAQEWQEQPRRAPGGQRHQQQQPRRQQQQQQPQRGQQASSCHVCGKVAKHEHNYCARCGNKMPGQGEPTPRAGREQRQMPPQQQRQHPKQHQQQQHQRQGPQHAAERNAASLCQEFTVERQQAHAWAQQLQFPQAKGPAANPQHHSGWGYQESYQEHPQAGPFVDGSALHRF